MSQNTVIEPFGNNTEVPAGYPMTSSLDENNAQIAASAAAAYSLKRMITGDFETIDPNDLTKETLYIDVTNVRWLINYAQQNDLRSISYPLDGVEKIRITCNGSAYVRFAIVTDATPTDLGSIDFATGESLRTVLSGQSEEFEVPSDADRVVINWNSDFVENPFGFVVIGQEGAVEQMIDEKLAGGAGLKNRIIVAASNTPEELAASADYKCTGTNDEVALNHAINTAIENKLSVLLLRGDYYLDAPTKKYSSNNDTFLLIDTSPRTGESASHSVVISGEDPWNVANLHIGSSAYEALDSSTQYHMVGVKDSTTYGGFVQLENLRLYLPDNQKKICALDFQDYGGYARLHSIRSYAYTNGYNGQQITISDPPKVAVNGCIGIRFICKGPNGTYGSEITDCNISGFNEGISLNTEWTILNHVCSIFCVTGWVFGKYANHAGGAGSATHPIVLINCGDERGVNLPLFAWNSGRQDIEMIAFSIERNANNAPGKELGNLAMETTQGSTHGRITYCTGQGSGNFSNIGFWTYGHGNNVKSVDTSHKLKGTSAERSGYHRNFLQQFYDTTLGKLLTCIDETNNVWIDAQGNTI